MKEGCNTIYILKVFTLYLQNNKTNLLVPKHSSTWKYLSIYYIFVTKSSNKIHTVLLYFTHIEQRHLGQMIWRPFLNHKSSWNSAPLSPKQKTPFATYFCQNEKVIKKEFLLTKLTVFQDHIAHNGHNTKLLRQILLWLL